MITWQALGDVSVSCQRRFTVAQRRAITLKWLTKHLANDKGIKTNAVYFSFNDQEGIYGQGFTTQHGNICMAMS